MVIIQEDKPIDLYSIKLTRPQKRYMVAEQILIIIFEALKYFQTILQGQKLNYILNTKILLVIF